jgi:hypothetical protein
MGKNCGIVPDGCGGTLRCGTCAGTSNDCRDNVCERGCRSNSECSDGTACINGSCSDKCNGPADCPSGQSCSNGSCVANQAQSCQYDSQCRSDERCMSGYCSGNNTNNTTNQTCRYDNDCRVGETCRNGLCSTYNNNSQTCRYDSDCPYNSSCFNGYCSGTNTGSGSTCRNDSDCRYGEWCGNGYCQSSNNNGNYGNGAVRARCETYGVGVNLPFGSIDFGLGYEQHIYYDSQYPNGIQVDSCICPYSGGMKVDFGSTTRTIDCSRCINDNGEHRTCYQ